MTGETLSILFQIPATDSLGRRAVDGKLRCLEDQMEIQFKIRDRTFKKNDDLEKIEIPYAEVEEARYEGGWFRKKVLILRTGDPALLESLPTADLGRVELLVDGKSKADASKIEGFVDFKRSVAILDSSHESWERARDDESQ